MQLAPSAQIRRQIYRGILEGRYAPGTCLPSIRDLAKSLKVSTKTVQKAVHGLSADGLIEARRGVGLIVQAPQIQSARSRHVALIHSNAPNYLTWEPYPSQVIGALEASLEREGFQAVRCSLAEQEWLVAVENVSRQRWCGLIFFEVDSELMLLEFRETRLPMVSMDYDAYRHGIASVTYDNPYGAFQATKHLLRLGHRRIVFVRPLRRNAISLCRSLDAIEDERLKGYRVAMQEAGLAPAVREFELGEASRQALLLDLFGRRPAPTALVCSEDAMGAALAGDLVAMGIRVPEDVSLFGFGDMGKEFAPGRRLSSVHAGYADMGEAAARLFIQSHAVSGTPAREILPTRLALHDSVAPVAREPVPAAVPAETVAVP